MDEKVRNELALFRFSLIAPLINGSAEVSTKDYLESVCARSYQIPGVGLREFSPATVKRWLSEYRSHGLEGLKRKIRNDKGLARTLSAELSHSIREIKQLYPKKTATAIYSELLNAGVLGDPPVSLSTVGRYIRKLKLTPQGQVVERKRFEFEYANDCWQTDVCAGPYLKIEGKKKKTFLIAFLDDASRLLVAGEFFWEENCRNLLVILKKAILSRGIPKRIFGDNGKIFDSLQLRLICASLGITLSHARPYSPESKGKIERMFRTLRVQFIDSLNLSEISSLEALNEQFSCYCQSTYNLRPHSSLEGRSPMERFLLDKDKLRNVSSEESLGQIFLHEATRKVKKDATISLNKKVFEVPQSLIGQSITVRFDPEDDSKAYVSLGNSPSQVPVYPVRPVDNSRITRAQNQRPPIDYASLYGGGEDN